MRGVMQGNGFYLGKDLRSLVSTFDFLWNEISFVLFSDEEGELEATYLPLKMRIYQAGGSKRENLIKAFDKPDDPTEKLRRLVELIEDD